MICTKGPRVGEIEWMDIHWHEAQKHGGELSGIIWKPFCDFEREKLIQVCMRLWLDREKGFRIGDQSRGSRELIGYSGKDYLNDSESSRLLKRAEFLKAVCEKEGVEWLPKEECSCRKEWPHVLKDGDFLMTDASGCCLCSCHKPTKPEKCEHDPQGHICNEKKCPLWRDTYTKEQVDAKLKAMTKVEVQAKSNVYIEEREFRDSLWNVLHALACSTKGNSLLKKMLVDLRKRFL